MCQGCFNEQWEGRDAMAFLRALPLDRQTAIRDARLALLAAASSVEEHDGVKYVDWMSGDLHCQVDDDNYDIDAERRKPGFTVDINSPTFEDRPTTMAEEAVLCSAVNAWNWLDEDERSILVAALVGYYLNTQPQPEETPQ